jgi:hypothetical protein
MTRLRARLAVPLLLVLAASSACGDEADPDTASDPASSPSSSVALEAITAQGIAGVVRDALGDEMVESWSEAGEDDSIGVLAKLAGRQVLVVNVQVAGEPPISSCDDLETTAMGDAECTVGDDGTIVSAGTAEPFSDDNIRGSTVLAQSVNPESGRVVYALYETYSRQAALDPAILREIVSDPSLAAMTDPATNAAGADIEVTAPGS